MNSMPLFEDGIFGLPVFDVPSWLRPVIKSSTDDSVAIKPVTTSNYDLTVTGDFDGDNLKYILDTSFMKPSVWTTVVTQKLAPVKIERMDKATAVHWNDGTVTVVRRCADEADSLYTAFCAALAKKMYGSTSKVHDVCDKHTVEYMNEQKERAKQEAREKQLKEEKLRHDRKIRKLAKRLRNEQEAKNLLNDK